MIGMVNKIEKLIYAVLMLLLIVVLAASLVGLIFSLPSSLSQIISPTSFPAGTVPEISPMLLLLGSFLLVLIGVELLDTIKAYFVENTIHVEIIVLLALIAVARKVILLEPANDIAFEMMGIGVLVIGLGAAYYLIKKAGITIGPDRGKSE